MKNREIFLKLIAAVLSLLVIFGCLAGCKGDKDNSSDLSSTPSESTSSEAVSSEELISSTPDTTVSETVSQPEPVVSQPVTSTPVTSTVTPTQPQGPTKPAQELIVGKWKGKDNFTSLLEQVAQIELEDTYCETFVEFTAGGDMIFSVDSATFAMTYFPAFNAHFEKLAEEAGKTMIEYDADYTNAHGEATSEWSGRVIETVAQTINSQMKVKYKFEGGKLFIGDGTNWEENPCEFTNDNTMIDKTNNQTYTRVS